MPDRLVSPVTYQGGKGKIADQCVAAIGLPRNGTFYDLCCGSGAISIAAINAGQKAEQICMVDAGPWGLVWNAIGNGSFDIARFAEIVKSEVPTDKKAIKPFLKCIATQPVNYDRVIYDFLLLQAGSFGGAPIWIANGRWSKCSFRDLWLPTETSHARSHVNPMMPMPTTIVERLSILVPRMRGVRASCRNLMENDWRLKDVAGVAYIDPPYASTAGYGFTLDAVSIAKRVGVECWISEGKPLSDHAIKISDGSAKGGMSGNRKKKPHEEWLSCFVPTGVI